MKIKNKLPMHHLIKQDILKKIQSGIYTQGELIPKEEELTDIYSVSRPTVRQAVQSLVNDGYLERRKRRGTIVKQQKIAQEFTHVIESYDSEMGRKGLIAKTKVLTFKQEPASYDVAINLSLVEQDLVYKLVRLRYVESKPIVLVTTYLPANKLNTFLDYDFTKDSLYSVLAKFQYPILQIRRKLEVLKADETISDLLDIDVGEPIFYFHSTAYSKNRLPIEYSISKYRGDINSFVFELNHNK